LLEKSKNYLPMWARHGLQNRASGGVSNKKAGLLKARLQYL
jgi:hypothetical protein